MPRLQYLTLREPSNPAQPRHLGYYEWGDAHNPDIVVCVHGLSRNAHDFDTLAKTLAPHYRVLCVDMAGRGNSSWLANKAHYSYPTYATDMLEFFKRLQLQHVNWVGTSMGGIIGMMIAAQQQNHIKRMVLGDVGSVVSAKGLTRIMGYVGTQTIFDTQPEAMAHLRAILAPWGIVEEAHWNNLFSASFIVLPDGRFALAYDPDISSAFKESISKGSAIADVDLTAMWNMIQCPVLILRGAESDILTHKTAEAMCKRTQQTKLIEIPNVGHAPALQDALQINAIAEWLENRL